MNVVQRCPSCGTTQATPGECEACHASQVRYFCTNHQPGLWLDGPTCPTCDAQLDHAARVASARAPSPPPARAPAWAPEPPPAYVLRPAVLARSAVPGAAPDDAESPNPIAQVGGCFGRLLLIAVVLLLALVGLLYAFGRVLLQQ